MNHSLQWSSDIARMKAELSWLDAVFVAEPEAQLLSSKAYRVVATIDSGRVFSRRFYEAIRCWGRQGAVGPAFLVVRSPDPIAYYWGDFGVVPLVEISMSTSGDLFLETLHFEPSGGADSISTLAEEFVFFDDSRDWIFLVERNGELARLFVKVNADGDQYRNCLPQEWCFDARDVEEHLQRFALSPSEIGEIAKTVIGLSAK